MDWLTPQRQRADDRGMTVLRLCDHLSAVLALLLLFIVPEPLRGQLNAGGSVDFANGFPGNLAGLTLNGNAVVRDNALQLTDGGLQEAGSAFFSMPVGLSSFHTEFDFQLTGVDGQPAAADGFTFIVQSVGVDALGSTGGGLGYGPPSTLVAGPSISKSMGLKFDLHNNNGEGETSTGIIFDGDSPTSPQWSVSTLPNVDLHSGHVFHAIIDYHDGAIVLTLQDTVTGSFFGDFFTASVAGKLGSPIAYAGFTASTGAKTAVQRILNWTLTSNVCCLAGAPQFITGFANPSDLTLNGSAEVIDGFLNLTRDAAFPSGSAYFPSPLEVNSFTSDFDFQMSRGNGEGFTFVIQSEGAHALGSGGGGLGYGPALPGGGGNRIKPSVALKFDLHSDDGEGSNSTGLYFDGASPTSPYINLAPAGFNLHGGDIFHVHLLYAGSTLTALLTDATKYKTWTQVFPVDLRQILGSPTAYFGFTAATSDPAGAIEIRNWVMSSFNVNVDQ